MAAEWISGGIGLTWGTDEEKLSSAEMVLLSAEKCVRQNDVDGLNGHVETLTQMGLNIVQLQTKWFLRAAYQGQVDLLVFCGKGLHKNGKPMPLLDAICDAADGNRINAVKLLLKKLLRHENIADVRDKLTFPFLRAASSRRISVAKHLHEALRFDARVLNWAMATAASRGSLEAIHWLILSGASDVVRAISDARWAGHDEIAHQLEIWMQKTKEAVSVDEQSTVVGGSILADEPRQISLT